MTKRLPKMLFVKWDYPAKDEAYLISSEDMFGLVETDGSKTKIGIYQLIETTDAEMIVNASKPVKAKR